MSTVSVIIPAYNQAAYLREAIDSVLAQTHADFEILVVDDGSTDDTRRVALSIADSRVRYVYQENRGLSGARNTGVRLARGAFLTYLDSDDRFLPEKLALLLVAFERNPGLGLVAGQALLVDEHTQLLGEVFDRALPADGSELLLGNPLHVGSVLLRREWQDRVGFFDESLRSYEDWDMWLRLSRAGCQMGWVARPVSHYRFHRHQMTRVGKQMTVATFAVLDKVFADPELPESWRSKRDAAYSRAFLRAAAQAYTGNDGVAAEEYMREAIRLAPELCADDAEPLARLVAGWANHVKTADSLEFLGRVYRHLPNELDMLRRRRHRDMARQCLQLAFAAHDRGETTVARSALRQAIGHQPRLLMDCRVVAALVRSTFPGFRRSARLDAEGTVLRQGS